MSEELEPLIHTHPPWGIQVDKQTRVVAAIAAQGDNRIVVQLPGVEDAGKYKAIINQTAKLTFNPVYKKTDPAEVDKWISEAEEKGGYTLGGEGGLQYVDYIKRLNNDLKGKLPPDTRIVFEKVSTAATMADGRQAYLVETNHDFSGDFQYRCSHNQ